MLAFALICVAPAGVAGWFYGERRGLRWVRACSAAVFVAVLMWIAGSLGRAFGMVETRVALGHEYVEHLGGFRAAALDRLEAGDPDAVAEELRRLEGQITYDHGPTFEALRDATERLSAPPATTGEPRSD